MVEGRQEGKDLSVKVERIFLPLSIPENKNSLLKQKFRQMCHNISAGKETVGYEASDFLKYDCKYTPSE